MNSIEVVNTPEKKAPQQAVDGPVLHATPGRQRVYVAAWGQDYQQAMKQVEKFHDQEAKTSWSTKRATR